jgi:phospholipid-binding lipoprotein MlaA
MRLRESVLLSVLALAWLASPAWAAPSDAPAIQPDATTQQTADAGAAAQTQGQNTDTSQQDALAEDDANDPLEGMNRSIFHASMMTDHYFFRPIALGYRHAVPSPVRNSIRHFLNNLDSPPIFANEIFQGEFKEAGITVLRFGVNSTIGVGGLFEVAEGWGMPRHTEDFGQTLGTYGIGEGPYLFLPLIGPAPPRDLTGRVVDNFLDPLTYVHMGSKDYLRYVRVGLDAVDLRERNIETLDDIERTSVDYYASIRSLYRQTRNNEISNGKTNVEDLPNF